MLLWVMTAGVCGDAAPLAQPDNEQSRTLALAVLEHAATALGGRERLLSIRTVRLHWQGETWERLQNPTVDPPFDAGAQQQTVAIDLETGRMRADLDETAAGMEFRNTTLVSPESATRYNHRARTAVAVSSSDAAQQRESYSRRVPHLLVRQALENADSLRYLGRVVVNAAAHDVITFRTLAETELRVYVDPATGLVARHESAYTDPIAGETVAEVNFERYVRRGDWLVPEAWVLRAADSITARLHGRIEIDPPLTAPTFEAPRPAYVAVEPPPDLEEMVEPLAKGVWVMRNIARRDLHSLAVEFTDHVLVVEAPWTSEGADRLIARIKETIPGKPIRYVALTHHHGDHVGGVRSFIAEGATVITTPGNRSLVDALARAPISDRLHNAPRVPHVVLVDRGKHIVSDGEQTVELIDIGPNPHAREMLVAYLPKERLLFEADVFLMPYRPQRLGAAQPTTRSFARRIRELGLVVDRFVATHGRTATFDELTALLAIPR